MESELLNSYQFPLLAIRSRRDELVSLWQVVGGKVVLGQDFWEEERREILWAPWKTDLRKTRNTIWQTETNPFTLGSTLGEP